MTGKAGAAAGTGHAWGWTFAVALSVYASSSIERLGGGDSGELLAEACVGGNAHPPGYPLLLLVLRAARVVRSYYCPHVPFAVVANCLNAVFAAGAAACVTHIVDLITRSRVESVAAGLMFAFSALTWEYALGLEVFALNNLLVGLLLVCVVRHQLDQGQSKRPLYAGALVCGLGLANQHTIVLLEIPLILWILVSTTLAWRDWVRLTIAFVIGISPYVATYASAQHPTPGSWGDASTLHGLVTHILRREYGTFQLSPIRSASDSLLSRLVFYATDVANELTDVGVACIVGGILLSKPMLTPDRRRLVQAFGIILTVYLLGFNSLANLPLTYPLPREVTRRFFLQPNLLLTILLGIGLATVRHCCEFRLVLRHLTTLAAITLTAHQHLRNRATFTTSPVAQHNLLRGFGYSILDSLPPNALLLSYTDVQWNTVRYLQMCGHVRPDVDHVNLQLMSFSWFERQHNLYPNIVFPPILSDVSTNRTSQGYATYLSRFVLANAPTRSIFLDLHGVDESTITNEQQLFGQLQVLPHGLVWRIVPPETQGLDHWREYAMPPKAPQPSLLVQCCGLASHIAPLMIPSGSWEFVVVSIAHDAMYQQSLAKVGYWLEHTTIQSVSQLEETVLALDAIHRTLNDVVWRGIQHTNGAITYELYAVEKNVVVSRQRFQLYLEVFAELSQDPQQRRKRSRKLMQQRPTLREDTIAQVENFLVVMETQLDSDAQALRHGLDTLKSKRTPAKPTQTRPPATTVKRKKRRKKIP